MPKQMRGLNSQPAIKRVTRQAYVFRLAFSNTGLGGRGKLDCPGPLRAQFAE